MADKHSESLNEIVRIMVIGSLPPPIGGTRVIMKYLTDALAEREDIKVFIVNTSIGESSRLVKGLWRTIRAVYCIIGLIRQVDVVTAHLVTKRLNSIGFIVYMLARLWKRPFLLRKHEGSNYLDYKQPQRGFARWVVNHSDLYLAETRALVKSALNDGAAHVEWYPNNRPLDEDFSKQPRKRESCRKFIFLSRISPEKGIRELIESGERLGQDFRVDVFGPFQKGLSEEIFAGLKRVHYCGVVDPEKVASVLVKYDVLVLPTHHKGEGYPGIIIEAYRAGLPVIATRWQALPEIVDETCGLLVEPYNADELYRAMKAVVEDKELYARLRRGVLIRRGLFDTKTWTDRFVGYCRSLIVEN